MNMIDSSCFAYPSMKKYPVHTKEDALNSYHEFCSDLGEYSAEKREEIRDRFEKAAKYYGITLQEQAKEASAHVNTIAFSTGDGGTLTMTEICQASDVEKAADFITANRDNMHRKQLKEAALYVLSQASCLDCNLEDEKLRKIARIAGIGVGDRDKIVNELEKRAVLNAADNKNSDMLWKYINKLKETPDSDFYKEAALNEICDVLDDIDHLYGNMAKYGSDFSRPEEVCFEETLDDLIKEASDMLYIPAVDTLISKKALLERRKGVEQFLEGCLGAYQQEKQASGEEQLFNTVANLDRDIAEALLEAFE